MSREIRDKRKKRKKTFKIVFLMALIVYSVYLITSAIKQDNMETYTVKKSYMEDVYEGDSVIIRDETIYYSEWDGSIVYFIENGEKIKVGTKVAEISGEGLNQNLTKELGEINQVLSISEYGVEAYKRDNILRELKKALKNKNYETVMEMEKRLAEIEGRTLDAEKFSEKELTKRRKVLLSELSSGNRTLYSQESGIVSYHVDGLEDVYTVEGIKDLKSSNIKEYESREINLDRKAQVLRGDPVFKVSRNIRWYMAFKFSGKYIENVREGRSVKVKVEGEDELLKGKVVKKEVDGEDLIVVIQFSDKFYKYYDQRFVDAKIVNKASEGLKIPKSSIVRTKTEIGVYVKDFNGLLRFKPIKILVERGDYAIVKEGLIDTYWYGKIIKKRTISMYDEIVFDASKVNKSKIIK